MWSKNYRDYPKDRELKKQKVEPLRGITGCEMHEINGWGESYHHHNRKRGLLYFLTSLFSGSKGEETQ